MFRWPHVQNISMFLLVLRCHPKLCQLCVYSPFKLNTLPAICISKEFTLLLSITSSPNVADTLSSTQKKLLYLHIYWSLPKTPELSYWKCLLSLPQQVMRGHERYLHVCAYQETQLCKHICGQGHSNSHDIEGMLWNNVVLFLLKTSCKTQNQIWESLLGQLNEIFQIHRYCCPLKDNHEQQSYLRSTKTQRENRAGIVAYLVHKGTENLTLAQLLLWRMGSTSSHISVTDALMVPSSTSSM